MLFSVSKASGPRGAEFVFLGRGWGHGVGLCQNGAYGMALAGASYDADPAALLHGIDIVPAAAYGVPAPSLR